MNLPDGIALGLILVSTHCQGGCIFQHHVLLYAAGDASLFRRNDNEKYPTLVSPVMTPLMVSLLASGTQITIKGLPMFVSIIETVILPVGVGFFIKLSVGKESHIPGTSEKLCRELLFSDLHVLSAVWYLHRGAKFFQSGVVIFVAVLLHNGLGYLLGYGAGKLVGMNTSKKRTISIKWVCRMPDLQRILQLQLPSLSPNRNLRLSVRVSVHGIPSQELC